MGSLAGKSPANTYKSLLKVADETNGVSDTISQIEDGEGTASCSDFIVTLFCAVPEASTVIRFNSSSPDLYCN